ncbi:hypothetical protein BRADI_4g30985v3 [Brachypodium distachyon]|uniref:Uncharacterized protein n=1 Tax=Brachypodium distachyon TaxID=15368 RepID=A0A0Q3IWB8_BRADI|nr:hypothetical protein BRADI_4g30985v3 [Brachypodium distachyon]KQJ90352.1 hypothetical protein BRADI_4g30985v3 [Brachypodium distachyon]
MPDHESEELIFQRTLLIVNGSTTFLVSNFVYFHRSYKIRSFSFFFNSCKSVLEMDEHGKGINCL